MITTNRLYTHLKNNKIADYVNITQRKNKVNQLN